MLRIPLVCALAFSVFTSKARELVVLRGDEATIHQLQSIDPFSGLRGKRVVAFAMTNDGVEP